MPLDVDDGLWLEDRGMRLAWGASMEALLAETRPDVCVRHSGEHPYTVLAWNDWVWDGLRCQVRAEFGNPGPFTQAALYWLRVVFQHHKCVDTVRDDFERLRAELEQRFGPPAAFTYDGTMGEARWLTGGVTIRHEYQDFVLGIDHAVYVFVRAPAA